MSAPLVIDANITLAQVLPLPYSDLVMQRMDAWRQARVRIVVPTLWEYEVVSLLRKATAREFLTQDQALAAIETILRLSYEQVPPSVRLDQRALAWAEVLGQSTAYDGQYLAVAEALGVEFWTADRRLANAVRQVGETWVHWVGEEMGG